MVAFKKRVIGYSDTNEKADFLKKLKLVMSQNIYPMEWLDEQVRDSSLYFEFESMYFNLHIEQNEVFDIFDKLLLNYIMVFTGTSKLKAPSIYQVQHWLKELFPEATSEELKSYYGKLTDLEFLKECKTHALSIFNDAFVYLKAKVALFEIGAYVAPSHGFSKLISLYLPYLKEPHLDKYCENMLREKGKIKFANQIFQNIDFEKKDSALSRDELQDLGRSYILNQTSVNEQFVDDISLKISQKLFINDKLKEVKKKFIDNEPAFLARLSFLSFVMDNYERTVVGDFFELPHDFCL